MSLINEALKKAQKQREAESAAQSGKVPAPGAGAPVAPPPPPPPPVAPPSAAPDPEPEPVPVSSVSSAPLAAAGANPATGSLTKILAGAVAVIGIGATGWWGLTRGDDQSEIEQEIATVAPKVAAGAAQSAAAEPPEAGQQNSVATTESSAATPPAISQPEPVAVARDSAAASVAANTSAAPQRAPTVQFVLESHSVANAGPTPPVTAQAVPSSQSSASTEAVSEIATVLPRSSAAVANVIAAAPTARPPAAPRTAAVFPLARDEVRPTVNPPPSVAAPAMTADTGGVGSAETAVSIGVGQLTILPDDESSPVPAESGSEFSPDPAVLAYLETTRVTGVRASPTDPKVLMNSRVYRLNEVVDQALQLRVTQIDSRQLEFTDPRGFVYTKSF